MHMLSFLYLVAAVSLPGHAVRQQRVEVPDELRPPMAAVYRIAYGLQTDLVCNRLTQSQRNDMREQLATGIRTLHGRLMEAKVNSLKAQRILVRMMEHGENLAKNDYPACTNLAPHIIVKASEDAACINQYLAGTNTACFR